MPELSIIMRLKDLITTKLKEIMELFNQLTGHTEEAAKKQTELTEKVKVDWKEHAEYHKDRVEWAKAEEEEYKREAELMESEANLRKEQMDWEQENVNKGVKAVEEALQREKAAKEKQMDWEHENVNKKVKIVEEAYQKELEAGRKLRTQTQEELEEQMDWEQENVNKGVKAVEEAADKIAKIQGYLTSVVQEENDKKLQDWNAFLSSTLDLTYETYDDLTEALYELNVADREKLRSKFRDWKSTLDSITEEEKEFYRKAKGYMGDFREMTKEELENVKKLWEDNVAKYEEIWDGFTQDVRSSFSDLFVDFMDGTKKSEDIWQDFCDSMVKSFKKAVADSLAEKMGFDKIFEGNILNWGNLFTGLGNLVTGVFTGLGKALSTFVSGGTAGFGTLGNVVGVFGKTLSGLIKSGGPLALVLGGMEALTRLVSGKSFIGAFLGGPMESEYSIERRKKFERERAGMEEQWRAQKLSKGFLMGWYGTMYHPETKEAYRWVGPRAEDQEAIDYPTYVAAQGAAFLEGIKLLQGGAVFNKPTFFRAIAGEGGEPEFLSPESLLRKIVREETQKVPSSYSFGPINIQFPNVTSFQDWLDADPGTIKLVFDRKIYQAMKMSAREGRISKEALLM